MARETVKIVIVGHVDHGKSTLIGRLLLDTNSLPKERIAEIKRISRELGRDTELAYLTDQLKEERERNVTIDTTQIFFKTKKRDFVIIDAPGHVEFLKNMITGATQAEAAVLIVDVDEGVKEQTRRHAYIVSMLGIKKVIIVFNKMDLVDFKEDKFNTVRDELINFMKELGVSPYALIPISAKEGDNVSRDSFVMRWYKGVTLLKALDAFRLDAKTEKKPLRYPVQDIYDVSGERVIVGRVASGVVKRGQDVVLLPSGRRARTKSIAVFGQSRTSAQAGESIGLVLKDSPSVKRGDVIVQEGDLPEPTTHFTGNIFWMSEEPLQVGKSIILRCATQEIACVAERIARRINSSTLEVIAEDSNELKMNEAGVVHLTAERPIVAEDFSFIQELGRFVIEHDYTLQGAGIVTSLK